MGAAHNNSWIMNSKTKCAFFESKASSRNWTEILFLWLKHHYFKWNREKKKLKIKQKKIAKQNRKFSTEYCLYAENSSNSIWLIVSCFSRFVVCTLSVLSTVIDSPLSSIRFKLNEIESRSRPYSIQFKFYKNPVRINPNLIESKSNLNLI